MIIGLISAFQEVFVREARIGRLVANVEFERALLTSCQAKELHFFCPTAAARSRFQQFFADLIRKPKCTVRFFTFLDLPACLKSFDYTALHQADPISYYPALAFLRNRHAPRVPLTMVTHTISYREIIGENFKKLLPGPMPFDAIVATSRTAAEMVRRNFDHLAQGLKKIWGTDRSFPGQIVQIPLGVDTQIYQPGDRPAARSRLRLPANAFVVLSLGRLNYFDKMDLLPLLRLWKEMAVSVSSQPPLLILAGSDEIGYGDILKGQIQALKLERFVFLHPNPDQKSKNDLLAAADVFISLADNVQETFGLTVIEAQAAGLPVLASDFNGYKDLIVDGQTGFLIPTHWAPDHPVAAELSTVLLNNISHLVQSQGTAVSLTRLASCLEELKSEPGRREEMGWQGRARVLKAFDWKVVVRAYEDLWDKLKKQALEYQGPSGACEDPFSFTWNELFGHYPTGPLSENARFALTTHGREYLRAQERPAMYSDITPLLSTELLKKLVTGLASGPKSLGEIQVQKLGFSPALVNYHWFWLMKNYFIKVEGKK